MRIVWDETKREANLVKHRLDFADLDAGFFARALLRPSHSDRWLATGPGGGQLLTTVVFRPLGSQAVSIISMRPASSRERRLYEQADGFRSR